MELKTLTNDNLSKLYFGYCIGIDLAQQSKLNRVNSKKLSKVYIKFRLLNSVFQTSDNKTWSFGVVGRIDYLPSLA